MDVEKLRAQSRLASRYQEALKEFKAQLELWRSELTQPIGQLSNPQVLNLVQRHQQAADELMRFLRPAQEGAQGLGFNELLELVHFHVEDIRAAGVILARTLADRSVTSSRIQAVMSDANARIVETQMRANAYQTQVYDHANRNWDEAHKTSQWGYCRHCRGALDFRNSYQSCPHCWGAF